MSKPPITEFDKAKVVAELKKSIEHLRATAKTMNEAELEKSVKLFGNNTTQRGVYGTILKHWVGLSQGTVEGLLPLDGTPDALADPDHYWRAANFDLGFV